MVQDAPAFILQHDVIGNGSGIFFKTARYSSYAGVWLRLVVWFIPEFEKPVPITQTLLLLRGAPWFRKNTRTKARVAEYFKPIF